MSLYTDVHQGVPAYRRTAPRARDAIPGQDADAPKKRTGRALFLLTSVGLDPKEIVLPWEQLTEHGCLVDFATWDGQPAKADDSLLHSLIWGSTSRIRERWNDIVSLPEFDRPYCWAPEDAKLVHARRRSSAAQTDAPAAATDSASVQNGQAQIRPPPVRRTLSDYKARPLDDVESYDVLYIPGGWCAREQLERDSKVHDLVQRYARYLPRQVGTKILAVSGDGIAPLLHVRRGHQDIVSPLSTSTVSANALAPQQQTGYPLLKTLASSGPGYDSWSGPVTGTDLGSLIPAAVREYRGARSVAIDPLNWYISAPSANWALPFAHKLAKLLDCALEVSFLRELASRNAMKEGLAKAEAATTRSDPCEADRKTATTETQTAAAVDADVARDGNADADAGDEEAEIEDSLTELSISAPTARSADAGGAKAGSIERRRSMALQVNTQTANPRHLTKTQRRRLDACERWDGATEREKELAVVNGHGVQSTGFVFKNFSWGWKKQFT